MEVGGEVWLDQQFEMFFAPAEVWFSLRVREVPGSIPGQALCLNFWVCLGSFPAMIICLMGEEAWPVGLEVWFSLRVREVPGSIPGQAPFTMGGEEQL